ncbi:MAG: hypothetical protein QXY94_06260, partial [Archaeoglobaceae archaeon]
MVLFIESWKRRKETHSSPKRMPINRLFNRCWHFQAVALLREELSHVLKPKMRIQFSETSRAFLWLKQF